MPGRGLLNAGFQFADLLPSRALNYGDVAIDRKISKSFYAPAGLCPVDFQLINLCAFADAKHFARIMGGEITSACYFETTAFQIASLPGDSCPNSIRVRLFSHQAHAQPMIA